MYERGDIQYDTKRNDSFKSHKPNHRLEGKTVNPTQFGKAMQELGINIIKARSPQAKGRIKKLWQTLQSRLKAELEIYGIDSIEFANAFLPKFIESYNKRFGVQPENPQPAFRPLDPSINLDYILCIKERRTIIEGSAFSYKEKYYQLVKDGKVDRRISWDDPRTLLLMPQKPLDIHPFMQAFVYAGGCSTPTSLPSSERKSPYSFNRYFTMILLFESHDDIFTE